MAKPYTKQQKVAIKEAANKYVSGGRKNCEGYITDLSKEIGKSYAATRSVMFRFIKNRSFKSKRGKIRRGSMMYKPEAIEGARQRGLQKWANIRERLKSFGLTDQQIATAFSGKTPKLDQVAIKTSEDGVKDRDTWTFTVIKHADMSLKVIPHTDTYDDLVRKTADGLRQPIKQSLLGSEAGV